MDNDNENVETYKIISTRALVIEEAEKYEAQGASLLAEAIRELAEIFPEEE